MKNQNLPKSSIQTDIKTDSKSDFHFFENVLPSFLRKEVYSSFNEDVSDDTRPINIEFISTHIEKGKNIEPNLPNNP